MQKNLILGYGQTGKSFEIFLNQKKVLFDIFDENYKPGHKSRKSNAAFISKNEIEILLDGKFVTERGRINCSLRENTGEWRWLGIQFVISNI